MSFTQNVTMLSLSGNIDTLLQITYSDFLQLGKKKKKEKYIAAVCDLKGQTAWLLLKGVRVILLIPISGHNIPEL